MASGSFHEMLPKSSQTDNPRLAHARTLISDALTTRLREIRKMRASERTSLNLAHELRNAAVSVLYHHAYSYTEMDQLRDTREALIQQALSHHLCRDC